MGKILTPEEAEALGLPPPPKTKRVLSPQEAADLGLPAPPSSKVTVHTVAPQSKAPEIDPEAAPEPDKIQEYLKPTSATGAAARGVSQGASLGFGDEAMAALDTLNEANRRTRQFVGLEDAPTYEPEPEMNAKPALIVSKIGGKEKTYTSGGKYVPDTEGVEREQPSLVDAYRQLRDSYRADNKTSQDAHPIAYGAGEIGGAMAVPLPGSGLARGAPLAARLGLSGVQAGGFGAVMAAGNSEADLTRGDVEGFKKDTIKGGLINAPLGVLGAAGGEGINALTRKVANTRYLKAAGAIQKDLQKVTPEQQEKIAEVLRNSEAVPFGANKETIANNLNRTLEKEGPAVGGALRDAVQAGNNFDPDAAAWKAVEQHLAKTPTEQRLGGGQLEGLVDDLAKLKDQGGNYPEANRMKTALQQSVNYSPLVDKPINDAKKEAAALLNQSIEEQLGAQDKAALKKLEEAKKVYGPAAQALDWAKQAKAREEGNNPLGLLWPVLAGGVGLGVGAVNGDEHHARNGLTPALMAALYMLANRRGSAAAAPALDALGRVMTSTLVKSAPRAVGPMLLENRDDDEKAKQRLQFFNGKK